MSAKKKTSTNQDTITLEFPPFDWRMVAVDTLHVDDAYQRDVKGNTVKAIQKSFDAVSVGTIVVGERSDGSLWIVDGQQRWTAFTRMMADDPRCKFIPAVVFESEGPKHEARVFMRINNTRSTVSPLVKYKGRIVGEDPDTLMIERVTLDCGFNIPYKVKEGQSTTARWPNIKAARAVEIYVETRKRRHSSAPNEEVRMQMMETDLRLFYRILSDSKQGDDAAVKGNFLRALGLFIDDQLDLDADRVIAVLRQHTASQIEIDSFKTAASRKKAGTGARFELMARHIERLVAAGPKIRSQKA